MAAGPGGVDIALLTAAAKALRDVSVLDKQFLRAREVLSEKLTHHMHSNDCEDYPLRYRRQSTRDRSKRLLKKVIQACTQTEELERQSQEYPLGKYHLWNVLFRLISSSYCLL